MNERIGRIDPPTDKEFPLLLLPLILFRICRAKGDTKSKDMKVVFYPLILWDDRLTICDKIVYSQLLYRTLWDTNEAFDREGNLDTSILQEEGGGWVSLTWSASKELYEALNISRAQFYQSKANLRSCGYLATFGGEERIQIVSGVEGRFFELKTKTGLAGKKLLVYSYLCHASARFGWVDKFHGKIAEALNLSPDAITKLLVRLCDEGFLEKKRRGRQVLLKPR